MPATTKPRKMSAAHKRALADGRRMSATVDRYLTAVNAPKRRGRKVSKAELERRLAVAQAAVKSATGIEKLMAAQDVRDLTGRLAVANEGDLTDFRRLQADFVKIAAKFSDARGITYGAWRDAGVPAAVLVKAKIARTRGPRAVEAAA